VTPAQDTALHFATWMAFEQICGQSRLWGGVQLQAAIDASRPMCHDIGDGAYRFLTRHIAGAARGVASGSRTERPHPSGGFTRWRAVTTLPGIPGTERFIP